MSARILALGRIWKETGNESYATAACQLHARREVESIELPARLLQQMSDKFLHHVEAYTSACDVTYWRGCF